MESAGAESVTQRVCLANTDATSDQLGSATGYRFPNHGGCDGWSNAFRLDSRRSYCIRWQVCSEAETQGAYICHGRSELFIHSLRDLVGHLHVHCPRIAGRDRRIHANVGLELVLRAQIFPLLQCDRDVAVFPDKIVEGAEVEFFALL